MLHFSPAMFYAWFGVVLVVIVLRVVQHSRRSVSHERDRQDRETRRTERRAGSPALAAVAASGQDEESLLPPSLTAEVPEEAAPVTGVARRLRTRADLIAAGALIPAEERCENTGVNDFMS